MTFAYTKIQPPRPRAGLMLARAALEANVASALAVERAVLLCAPAGCGKTALVSRALLQLPAGTAVAWVSLDPDDDLQRLLDCLIAALEPFDLPWRTSPEGLVGATVRAGAVPPVALMDEFVNTLAACDVPHGVVVLDDVHHLADTAALAFLDHWLQRMDGRWTLALLARHEPALRLARLRAAGELVEWRDTALHFGREDARALLMQGGLDAATAEAMYERTGGWAAGLRLALGGARGGNPAAAIDRPAFDFLATEVLARIDPELRGFLVRTCVLHDLDADRCAALTGDRRAAQWLDEIERLGLFANLVGETPRTLRLHDLFRDALNHRLALEQPAERIELLVGASRIETDPQRQQSLLLAAGRPEEAARRLLEHQDALQLRGIPSAIERMLAAFPPSFAAGSAEWQCVAGMLGWSVWDAIGAERHLQRAEQLFAARDDTGATLRARAKRCIVQIGLGRLQEAAALLATLEAEPLQGEARITTRLASTWLALEDARYHAVSSRFAALVQAQETDPRIEVWFHTVPPPRQTPCRGIAPVLRRWAEGTLRAVGDRPLPLRALAWLNLGWLALWGGQLDQAQEWLERAEADAQWTGRQVIARSQTLAFRGLLLAMRGQHAEAMHTVRTRLEEYNPNYGHWGAWHMHFWGARIAACGRDAAALTTHLQAMDALKDQLPDATPRRLQPVLGLRGLLADLQGQHEQALTHWHDALADEEACDLLGQAAELHVRIARLQLRAGAVRDAARALSKALAHASEGPCGALLAPDALQELASHAWSGLLDGELQQRLNQWAGTQATAAAAAAEPETARPDAALADSALTARESEVLVLIARGDSNKVIARELDLSPFTVKRHVAHILDKLMVGSRGHAAAWYQARQR